MHDRALITRAREFAMRKHGGLYRPNKTKLPIWTHLEEVATLVEHSGGSIEEIVAAWLHDTIEDTGTLLPEIDQNFGQNVAKLVDGLTDKPDITDLRLLERKMIQAERVRDKCPGVKRVKKADQTSNTYLVTIDPPLDWDYVTCTDYIRGAAAIAKECEGVSAYLDIVFELAFRKALIVYPDAK